VTWRWDIVRDGAAMEALAGAWDVAGARVGASAFARPAFALAHATAVLHFGAPSAEKLRWSSGVVPLVTLRIHAATRRARVAYAAPALVDALARARLGGTAIARGRAALTRLRAAVHRLRVRVGKRRRHRGPRHATRSAIQSTTTSTARAAVSSGAPVASTMRPIPERPFTSRR